ncbi:hypothetical protein AK812_SmicGene20456 [Symbiodinium microadriaticum]|uniref:Ribonuclease PIN domain-containing protein n=1 Tax=Symbiodinium microadriaticum TaxID=2951 RepID=A0A1Q9DPY0_SYMMI|nr:hypothetical protein AK812_SmicGene20456 [Symbiodinium microadriaticum]
MGLSGAEQREVVSYAATATRYSTAVVFFATCQRQARFGLARRLQFTPRHESRVAAVLLEALENCSAFVRFCDNQSDIVFAKQFSKATGDFGFLSTNDLDLIALTVRLHREAHLSLKDRPAALETRSEGRAVPFDWGPQRAPATTSTDAGGVQQPATEEDAQGDDGWAVARGRRTRGARAGGLKSDGQRAAELPQSVEDARPDEEAKTMTPPDQTTTTAPSVDTEGGGIPKSDDEQAVRETQDAGDAGAELQEDGELSEDGSSAGEWVTEENMHRFGIGIQPKADLRVTCATADYSVQNVLHCQDLAGSQNFLILSFFTCGGWTCSGTV